MHCSHDSGIRNLKSGILLTLLLTTVAHAEPHWRLGAGYAPIIGLRAEFSGFGNFTNPFPVPAPAPGTGYTYTDGFVLVDSSGNFGGVTTFWGYNNAAQFNPAGGGSINFTTLASSLSQAGSVAESNIAAAAGMDLYGYLHIGAVKIPAGRNATWGLRTGFQYARADIDNSDTLTAAMTTINDSFALNGVFPLAPGVPGSFLGPNALLSDTPTRTFGATTATLSGTRSLDVQLAILQFGSYLDIPITQKLELKVESGFLLGLATGSYDYTTTVTVPGVGAQTTGGSTRRSRVLPGFYAGLGLTYNVTPRLGLQAAARYQYMRPFDLTTNGSAASLNFDSAFVLSLSAVWKF